MDLVRKLEPHLSVKSEAQARLAKWGELIQPETKLAIALRYLAGGDPKNLKLICRSVRGSRGPLESISRKRDPEKLGRDGWRRETSKMERSQEREVWMTGNRERTFFEGWQKLGLRRWNTHT